LSTVTQKQLSFSVNSISEVVVTGIAVYISLAVSHSYCKVASIGSDANMGFHFIFGPIVEGCFINCWNNA
jgi:hypothetical protein